MVVSCVSGLSGARLITVMCNSLNQFDAGNRGLVLRATRTPGRRAGAQDLADWNPDARA